MNVLYKHKEGMYMAELVVQKVSFLKIFEWILSRAGLLGNGMLNKEQLRKIGVSPEAIKEAFQGMAELFPDMVLERLLLALPLKSDEFVAIEEAFKNGYAFIGVELIERLKNGERQEVIMPKFDQKVKEKDEIITFGRLLKEHRLRAKMSQAKLSAIIGVSTPEICRLEKDNLRYFSGERLLAITKRTSVVLILDSKSEEEFIMAAKKAKGDISMLADETTAKSVKNPTIRLALKAVRNVREPSMAELSEIVEAIDNSLSMIEGMECV